jgi:hypothetical protein
MNCGGWKFLRLSDREFQGVPSTKKLLASRDREPCWKGSIFSLSGFPTRIHRIVPYPLIPHRPPSFGGRKPIYLGQTNTTHTKKTHHES